MEFQKLINLLDNEPSQPSKFKRKNLVEINDDSRRTFNTNSKIKYRAEKLEPSLCDYSDACMLVKRTITSTGTRANGAARQPNKRNNEKSNILKLRTIY